MDVRKRNFKPYIVEILKVSNTGMGIGSKAAEALNGMVITLVHKIAEEIVSLMKSDPHHTLKSVTAVPPRAKRFDDASTVGIAIKLALGGGEIAKSALNGAAQAVDKYLVHLKNAPKGTKTNKAKKVPIETHLSASRIMHLLRDDVSASKVSKTAGIAIAGALDNVIMEVVDTAADHAKEHKRVRISPRHILLAVNDDDERRTLLAGNIGGAGAREQIQVAILPSAQRRKLAREAGEEPPRKRHRKAHKKPKKKTAKKRSAHRLHRGDGGRIGGRKSRSLSKAY